MEAYKRPFKYKFNDIVCDKRDKVCNRGVKWNRIILAVIIVSIILIIFATIIYIGQEYSSEEWIAPTFLSIGGSIFFTSVCYFFYHNLKDRSREIRFNDIKKMEDINNTLIDLEKKLKIAYAKRHQLTIEKNKLINKKKLKDNNSLINQITPNYQNIQENAQYYSTDVRSNLSDAAKAIKYSMPTKSDTINTSSPFFKRKEARALMDLQTKVKRLPKAIKDTKYIIKALEIDDNNNELPLYQEELKTLEKELKEAEQELSEKTGNQEGSGNTLYNEVKYYADYPEETRMMINNKSYQEITDIIKNIYLFLRQHRDVTYMNTCRKAISNILEGIRYRLILTTNIDNDYNNFFRLLANYRTPSFLVTFSIDTAFDFDQKISSIELETFISRLTEKIQSTEHDQSPENILENKLKQYFIDKMNTRLSNNNTNDIYITKPELSVFNYYKNEINNTIGKNEDNNSSSVREMIREDLAILPLIRYKIEKEYEEEKYKLKRTLDDYNLEQPLKYAYMNKEREADVRAEKEWNERTYLTKKFTSKFDNIDKTIISLEEKLKLDDEQINYDFQNHADILATTKTRDEIEQNINDANNNIKLEIFKDIANYEIGRINSANLASHISQSLLIEVYKLLARINTLTHIKSELIKRWHYLLKDKHDMIWIDYTRQQILDYIPSIENKQRILQKEFNKIPILEGLKANAYINMKESEIENALNERTIELDEILAKQGKSGKNGNINIQSKDNNLTLLKYNGDINKINEDIRNLESDLAREKLKKNKYIEVNTDFNILPTKINFLNEKLNELMDLIKNENDNNNIVLIINNMSKHDLAFRQKIITDEYIKMCKDILTDKEDNIFNENKDMIFKLDDIFEKLKIYKSIRLIKIDQMNNSNIMSYLQDFDTFNKMNIKLQTNMNNKNFKSNLFQITNIFDEKIKLYTEKLTSYITNLITIINKINNESELTSFYNTNIEKYNSIDLFKDHNDLLNKEYESKLFSLKPVQVQAQETTKNIIDIGKDTADTLFAPINSENGIF